MDLVLKKNEEKVLPFVWIDGEEVDTRYVLTLEDDSYAHIVGIFIGTGEKSATFHTTVIHRGKRTKSMTSLRGVFFDKASFNNEGLIRIEKGATGSDGFFASKILLFDDAIGRSIPSLEIDENDLKAGHASTVGRPDEEQLFYLRSRGLTEKDAQLLIISGFFEPVLQYFPEKDKKKILKRIQQKLKKRMV